MSSNTLDNVFGLSSQALEVWQRRSEVIASNLANADTPNYQARDVDFRQVLQQASGDSSSSNLELNTPTQGQINTTTQSADALKYRVPLQPSMDGNTVDSQVEQSAYASNMVHYQASLSFINSAIQTLRLAINGGGQS
ncbi:flagellar basal body rod protein FlgB [Dyella mobilis]|uniref:Flagellar basal body rod protein FlgB n=1 Tax=Dyella mobilis TaxID=1849582 RepID=A0ABS2KBF4_9GAMM|nr:flagellar basal body rod protein FlgB [Dyella mobilis]MBM7128127.1 flagellar basal body rod protein FlgB [Dyella mobilis]GLQ99943.1 flagellar basal body rod protein FlgB [Dyella mobilis]